MEQLIDIPYSKLKENKRGYEIMLLRDLHDNTFPELAKKYGVSVGVISNNYYKMKSRQIHLYTNHLSIVSGQADTVDFGKLYSKLYECYQDYKYITAYLEREYTEALLEYRAGEPGLPDVFLDTLPPFKENWSRHIINRVVEMREEKKLTYTQIGQRLKMTVKSAESIYQHYYHDKFMKLSDKIMARTGGKDIRRKYYNITSNSKKRYDLLCQDYPAYQK